jgi:hypothetical protein
MSPEAKMLERHGWLRVSPKSVIPYKAVWWLDPVDHEVWQQWRAIGEQRERNRQAREAKREARA